MLNCWTIVTILLIWWTENTHGDDNLIWKSDVFVCPPGYTRRPGSISCYKFYSKEAGYGVDWELATKQCTQDHRFGKLLVIDDPGEYDFIKYLWPTCKGSECERQYFWIGAANTGSWEWIDETPLPYNAPWDVGFPLKDGKCAALNYKNDKVLLVNAGCYVPFYFICEIDLTPDPCPNFAKILGNNRFSRHSMVRRQTTNEVDDEEGDNGFDIDWSVPERDFDFELKRKKRDRSGKNNLDKRKIGAYRPPQSGSSQYYDQPPYRPSPEYNEQSQAAYYQPQPSQFYSDRDDDYQGYDKSPSYGAANDYSNNNYYQKPPQNYFDRPSYQQTRPQQTFSNNIPILPTGIVIGSIKAREDEPAQQLPGPIAPSSAAGIIELPPPPPPIEMTPTPPPPQIRPVQATPVGEDPIASSNGNSNEKLGINLLLPLYFPHPFYNRKFVYCSYEKGRIVKNCPYNWYWNEDLKQCAKEAYGKPKEVPKYLPKMPPYPMPGYPQPPPYPGPLPILGK